MIPTLRPELVDLPARIRRLPLDRGYPVPWFVEWVAGRPEFRAMDGQKFARAIREKRCWVCGDALGAHLAFVTGPMCTVTRTTAEPPCHYDCAVWSARFCPFLSRPHMVRREDEQINASKMPDAGLTRNPGCAAVWTTKSYTVFRTEPHQSAVGYLLTMGEPEHVEWYAEGRPATRAEVLHSIETGMPTLEASCERERYEDERARAHLMLDQARLRVERWLPTEGADYA